MKKDPIDQQTVRHSELVKETFDMEPAIKKLEQSISWLQKALELAREGTTESLLQYFQVGYTGGTWHFPSMATRYAHGIAHRLAKMLEDELLSGTGFHFRYNVGAPQNWHLYYTDPNSEGEAKEQFTHWGRLVATLNIWKREIYIHICFEDKYADLNRRIQELQTEVKKKQEWLEQTVPWLQRYEKRLWVKWFRKRQVKAFWKAVRRQQELITTFRGDISRFEEDKIEIKTIEEKIGVLRQFRKYGFDLHFLH